jgi:hypothetical protein
MFNTLIMFNLIDCIDVIDHDIIDGIFINMFFYHFIFYVIII